MIPFNGSQEANSKFPHFMRCQNWKCGTFIALKIENLTIFFDYQLFLFHYRNICGNGDFIHTSCCKTLITKTFAIKNYLILTSS